MSAPEEVSFHTPRKEGFDIIVDRSQSEAVMPAEAYEQFIVWEGNAGLPPATMYTSTAITSGGYVRNPAYSQDKVGHMPTIIAENNRTAELLVGKLVADNPYVQPDNTLLTTELGKVKGWEDSDYMQFWLYSLSGITPEVAASIDDRFADADYAGLLTAMNDRSRANPARWPAYRRFTEQLLKYLDRTNEGQLVRPPIGNVLQLIDVERSLGCRAESLAAKHRNLPLLAPEIKPRRLDPNGELRQRIGELAGWGAQIGLKTTAVRLSVVSL